MANPYAAPVAGHQAPYGAQPADSQLSPAIIESMKQTRPWVLFLGIMALIGSGFMVLGGLGMMLAGAAVGGAEAALLAVFYVLFAGLYVYPGLALLRYAGAIKTLLSTYSVHALEDAIAHQKSFWKFVGVLTAVMMVLYFVAIIVGIAVGASSAMF